ncbi:hypothetical protein HCG49_13905 [Arenibacter sp. 6A1]|uniref:hypothetical protein n=1 Tax=Arenibacter sp. 6A1 TaxID=2720391 RepID=UPI0014452AA0|nr:hypothetical protein [Arenibacter sp. 6A1]NKI27659.1 hypothetical protein [Arenibacter sp. 6A1]
MKKLNLKKLNLKTNDLLLREQLKTIVGGYGNGSCHPECSSNADCGYPQTDEICVNIKFPDGCITKRCVLSFS